jgi:hypothetical protein
MSVTRRFHWKVFVSFYVAFSFLTLAVSGLVLYVAPPGRIANWSIWTLGALSKAQWQAVHTIFALLFLVAASFHIYFNWKVLMAYLRSKLVEGLRMKWELAGASAAALLLLTVSVAGVPPFSTVMAFGEDVKNSWSTTASEPPVPHAELMTVEKLAETVKIPTDKVMANLQQHGITVASLQVTVKQLADQHQLSPQQVYQRIQSEDAKPKVNLTEGGGWGRMNVQQTCERFSVSLDAGLARLKAAGIDAESGTMIRELATARGKTPIDIAKVIVGDDGTVPSSGTHTPSAGRQGGPGRGDK